MVDALSFYDINMKDENEVILALMNEAIKQFEDRLVNLSQKEKFKKLVKPIFGQRGDQIFTIIDNKLKYVPRK